MCAVMYDTGAKCNKNLATDIDYEVSFKYFVSMPQTRNNLFVEAKLT